MEETKKKKNVRLTRAKADELIALLMERIEMVNKDPQYLFGICRVAVFGSYLTDKERLGDLDIAVDVGPKCRDKDTHWDRCRKQSRKEYHGHSMIEGIYYSQLKTVRALRGRNYAFSVHEFSDYEQLVEEHGIAGRELYRNDRYVWFGKEAKAA